MPGKWRPQTVWCRHLGYVDIGTSTAPITKVLTQGLSRRSCFKIGLGSEGIISHAHVEASRLLLTAARPHEVLVDVGKKMFVHYSLCACGSFVWRCPFQNRVHHGRELDDRRIAVVFLASGDGDTR